METLTNYIKPELLSVSIVLYLFGTWFKQANFIKDKFIPFILGILGIILCTIWVVATCPLNSGSSIAMAIFTAIIQGILVAGLSTYVNQLIKQSKKVE